MQRFKSAFGYFTLGFAISLFINYWLRQEEARKEPMARGFASPPPPVPPVPPMPPAPAARPKAPPTAKAPDDLTQITGVGPKTAEALNKAGITTYAQRAAASPKDLLETLEGVRGVNKEKLSAWIKQARKLKT
jgi:predicted flap endonuclease-1-like 5' DNA nuclease